MENSRSRYLRRRKRNRRIQIQRRGMVALVADGFMGLFRRALRILRAVGLFLLFVGVLAATGWGGRWAFRHVMESPRFAVKDIQVSPLQHIPETELVEWLGVGLGQSLLAVDTDQVAKKLSAHPWILSAKVRRSLPSTLVIEVVEQNAIAQVALDGLYLINESGRPFKRATMEEADGLPVITGISRDQYQSLRDASEAAFRQAWALLKDYRQHPARPEIGEIAIEPRFGFSLFFADGGAEIRLGRDGISKKLAQLDEILDAVLLKESGGHTALRLVHLDLPNRGQVPVLMRGSVASHSESNPSTNP